MKKTKDVSDEDEYSADDPEEVEGAGSEEDWAPEAGTEGTQKKRPQRAAAKKRPHSEEEDEEEEDEEDDDEDEEEEEEDEEESDSDTAGKKPKRKRRAKNEDEEEDSDEEFNETGEPPKDFTSGAFVIAKADMNGDTDPTLWRIDGKALLQKYLPFQENGKTLYKSTSTYSGWSIGNKEKYLAAQVTFKVQSRNETIVELHPTSEGQQEQEVVKEEKED